MAEDIDKTIAEYIEARDLLKLIDAKWEEKRKPLLDLQERLSGMIRTFMDANNITDHLKSASGTCYLSTRYTATLADPEAFMQYVIKNEAFDLMDRRANSTAIKEFVKEYNVTPPGCNLNAVQTVGVRRPTK